MRKQNGTTTVTELSQLAASVGLVENSENGRQAFSAWYATDAKAARKAVFAKTAARRVAASAAKAAAASTGKPSAEYPASWARRVLSATSGVRVQRGQQ